MLPRALLERLKAWPVEDAGSGEAELATRMYDDFSRFPAADEGTAAVTADSQYVSLPWLASQHTEVKVAPPREATAVQGT
jgi:hypothetical protein